ncbi:hypothetical protein K7X08_035381 [Anisodus acutangulus]|uniref:Uncharacterized protein n=1 Tax=Anisodus acutangulus TaxID=402998 RepID=A0A9Q1LIN7_9SOLA|nr:hypothetical protein K7X08_035381 [Anisodus acutangulus]
MKATFPKHCFLPNTCQALKKSREEEEGLWSWSSFRVRQHWGKASGVSKQIFPLTQVEVQAVKGVRRKFDADSSPSDSCAFKRRRDAHFHPSPFERSFTVQICDLPRGLDFEQIESAISLELLNMDRSVEESNNCQIKWCLVTTLKCDCPAVSFVT